MNLVLADMIERFRAAQDLGVEFVLQALGPAFGVRLPSSNVDWVVMCEELGLYKIRQCRGISVHAHGFGIELAFDGLTIDFDWGESGEPDGFDAWRLWNFVRLNGIAVNCADLSQVRSWLEEAETLGDLSRDRFLYYSSAHRAKPLTV